MKLLIISDNYPPETNANARIVSELASYWLPVLEKISVMTCCPNFPAGKPIAGYKNSWRKIETIEGIEVIRVKTYMAENIGFFKRSLDFVSFGLSSFFFGLFQKKPDVIIGISPQFFCGISACLLSIVKRTPFVLILCDLWPDAIISTGVLKKGLLFTILKKLEFFMYKHAKLIVTLSPFFNQYLESHGIHEKKIFTSISGVSPQFYKRDKNTRLLDHYHLHNKFVVAYIGTLGLAHNHEDIISIASDLKAQGNDSIQFLMIGAGANRKNLESLTELNQLNNVIIDGPFPANQMPEYWSMGDIALVLLADIPTNKTVIPSKMLEAMAMGKPIVLYAPEGEAQKFLQQSQAGVFIPVGNSHELRNTLLELYNNNILTQQLAQQASAFASQYTRENQANTLIKQIKTTIEKKKS